MSQQGPDDMGPPGVDVDTGIDWHEHLSHAQAIPDTAIRNAMVDSVVRNQVITGNQTRFIREWDLDRTFIRERLAHLEQSEEKLDSLIGDVRDIAREVQGLRGATAVAARHAALARTPLASDLSPTGAFAALNYQSAEQTLATLPIWKARPAAVAGLAGAIVTLVAAFGVHIAPEVKWAIVSVSLALFGFMASIRQTKTTTKIVNAAVVNEQINSAAAVAAAQQKGPDSHG